MGDLRSLPKVDALSRHERLAEFPEKVRVEAARAGIDEARAMLLAGKVRDPLEAALSHAIALMTHSMRRVINGSGVVLHTGLGRARLAPSVVNHLCHVASQHSLVELDLDSGERGDRQEHVRGPLRHLTGAEDAYVVNNAAAAVLLTLTALFAGRDVILSRGQMVEIGGSFRMPEIIRQSGCRLVEVGCTNKTHLRDYEESLSDQTGAILHCHTSNYRIVGFAETPSIAELTSFGVPVVADQGTGCLVDTLRFGFPQQPTVQDAMRSGADLVIASCDKMLGGPQAGMILGRSDLMAKIRKHPLARCVRVDKLTLAALQATLGLYRQGRELEIPTLRYLSQPIDEVRAKADRLAEGVGTVEQGVTEVGGGSAPGTGVPTWRVGLSAPNPDTLARQLRTGAPTILGRIENDQVWLDPRTMEEEEIEEARCRLKKL